MADQSLISSYAPFGVAIFVLLVMLSRQRLDMAAQPLRLAMADLGVRLLSCDLSKADRKGVEFGLKHAFSMRGSLAVSMFRLPIDAVRIIVDRRAYKEWNSDWSCSPEVKALLIEFTELEMRLTFFNNPILFAIVVVEILLFIGTATLVGAVVHGVVPIVGRREVLTSFARQGVAHA